MEQLGDATKHEHRYVVYRHKATVESSSSEENGMIWSGTGPFSDVPFYFVATLSRLCDTMDQFLQISASFARGLTRQAVVARRCWYGHGRTGFGLSSC